MTLTEFLLARIAEDEQRDLDEITQGYPLEAFEGTAAVAGTRFKHRLRAAGYAMSPGFVQRSAATRYAEHEDYREEWRP